MTENNSNDTTGNRTQLLIKGANQQRHYGTASGVAGLVGGVAAGLAAAPAVGVAIGIVGVAAAATMLFKAEGKEKQARLEQQKSDQA